MLKILFSLASMFLAVFTLLLGSGKFPAGRHAPDLPL